MIARGVVVSKLANKQACNATKSFEKSHLTYHVIFFLSILTKLKMDSVVNMTEKLRCCQLDLGQFF